MRIAFALLLFVTAYAPVEREYELVFPRDEGSHPQFRTEWWYATGWLETKSGESLGFQITFFRSRPFSEIENPSAFAPEHILFAHAAIADANKGKLVHEQRSARAGFDLAGAKEREMNVWIRDWIFRREHKHYIARVQAEQFELDLKFMPEQRPLLQGDRGFSRKGKNAESASHYYSLPQLAVTGSLSRDGKSEIVSGNAWLDHEWSSTLLEADAVGWDWIGINLADGGALMVFQIRDSRGREHWAGGSYRDRDGALRTFGPEQIEFTALSHWKSPRSGTTYPIEWRVMVADFEVTLRPMMQDQELDARSSTGALYWEGAVRAYQNGELAGRGYLELTGYDKPLRLN
jgi:predicted secreted hydrolase